MKFNSKKTFFKNAYKIATKRKHPLKSLLKVDQTLLYMTLLIKQLKAIL